MADSAIPEIQPDSPIVSDESLIVDIQAILESVKPPISPECCIYRVPDALRKLNDEAYTPQAISIGPFHHGNGKLQVMEDHKARYLNGFLKREDVNVKLEDLVRAIKDLEERVRQSYAETIPLNTADFVKIILMDAGFIMECFRRDFLEEWNHVDDIELKPWLSTRMQSDLLLLENQLPFFMIEKLHTLAFGSTYPSFLQLTFCFFHCFNDQKKCPDPTLPIVHSTDLLRHFYLPPRERPLKPRTRGKKVEEMYTAAELSKAGLKFVGSSRIDGVLDLKYSKGVLTIPRFTLDCNTEVFARNLMALEQCHYPKDAYITDYFVMLDFLIDSGKDMDLLAEKKILVKRLGDNNATFVNNLGKDVLYTAMNTDYYDICKSLVDFYKNPVNSWKANLRRDYFSSPWIIVSTIGVTILLVLTVIQTVCTAIPLFKTLPLKY